MKNYKENYIPGSISFSAGFLRPQSSLGFQMIYDDKKARGIIKELKKKKYNIESVDAGLDGDWTQNSCCIYQNSKKYKYDVYNESCWATPIIIVNFMGMPSRMYEVWKK